MNDEFVMITYDVRDGEKEHTDHYIMTKNNAEKHDVDLIHMMYHLDGFDTDEADEVNAKHILLHMLEHEKTRGWVTTDWGMIKVVGKNPMSRETKELFNSYGVY